MSKIKKNNIEINETTKNKKKKIIRRIIVALVIIAVAIFLGQWLVPAILKAIFL